MSFFAFCRGFLGVLGRGAWMIPALLAVAVGCSPRTGAQDAAANGPGARPLVINAVGDILLARGAGPVLRARGFDYLLNRVAPLLADADLAVGNLESIASFLGRPKEGKPPEITLRAEPGALIGLLASGIGAVSLANNHSTDYYGDALLETIAMAKVLGIATFGAGADDAQARTPALIERRGRKIALLGFVEPGFDMIIAGPGRAGVSVLTESIAVADIRKAREANPDAVILAVLHWGVEFASQTAPEFRRLGKALVDAGADGVLGCHPHVLQGIELYRGKPIFYSLGNFVFDFKELDRRRSMIARISFDARRVAGIELIPTMIDRDECFAYPASGADARSIVEEVAKLSKAFGTRIEFVEGKGRIALN
jgi:poly-gamma-glutamate synthesis protein (capsule biosynthesis protein)